MFSGLYRFVEKNGLNVSCNHCNYMYLIDSTEVCMKFQYFYDKYKLVEMKTPMSFLEPLFIKLLYYK